MCAVSIEGVKDAIGQQAQSVDASSASVSTSQAYQQEERPVEQEGIVCPECNTSNEIGWSFCQQCGKRLPKSPPPPPAADLKVSHGFTTVRDQQAIINPGAAQTLRTVVETPPAVEQGLRTVADSPAALEEVSKTAAEELPADDQATTLAQKSIAPEPAIPAPPAAASHIIEPSPSAQPSANSWDAQTVVTEAPPRGAITPSTAPGKQPNEPPSSPAPEAATQHVQSFSGMLCRQCGQTTNVGSTFCANCGAPTTFKQTIVMSSQAAPSSVRGRLHLVMEGGQPGDVYDLGEDTVIGRSNGEISFPHDGFMSGRHARIVKRGNTYTLSDEGSRNGTFVKIKGEVELKPGDMILVGKQLFRFEV